VPASVTGIEKYIGSGLIKGIGFVMAKRIVQKVEKEILYRRQLKSSSPQMPGQDMRIRSTTILYYKEIQDHGKLLSLASFHGRKFSYALDG
jgi:hypothetical protein